jgi:beta-mannosidase
LGRPKATWFALRRVWAPVAVLLTDEGLNGLRAHLVNDNESDAGVVVVLDLYADGEHCVEHREQPVTIPARGGLSLDAEVLLEGFRDITYAFRFGPPAYDLVAVTLRSATGHALCHAVHLIGGQSRPFEADVGLSASLREDPEGGGWIVDVSTRRFAQWVCLEMIDAIPEDSWFHLPPGSTRSLRLATPKGTQAPGGTVRALNALRTAPLRLAS